MPAAIDNGIEADRTSQCWQDKEVLVHFNTQFPHITRLDIGLVVQEYHSQSLQQDIVCLRGSMHQSQCHAARHAW